MSSKSYYSWNGNNLLVELQVQTKANKNGIAGEYNNRLKITVTASPIKGKANECIVKFLAKYFGVPQKQVSITKGAQSKHKSIMVENPRNNLEKFKKCDLVLHSKQ